MLAAAQCDRACATEPYVLRPYMQEFQETYTKADGLASNEVRSVAVDVGGTAYFGTASGVSAFIGGSWRSFSNWIMLILTSASTG